MLGWATEGGFDLLPGTAVSGTAVRSSQVIDDYGDQWKCCGDDLGGLADASARSGVEGVERPLLVFGGQPGGEQVGLLTSLVSQPGATALAADDPGGVADGLTVTGRKRVPWSQS